jgi:hypothetical protein
MPIELSDAELREFMRGVMTRKGLNVNSWSKLAKKSEGTLRQFFDDPTRSLKVTTLKDYLDAVGMQLADIRKQNMGLRENSRKLIAHSNKAAEAEQTIPIIGYIGANGRFFPNEGRGGRLEELPVTANMHIPASELLALKIKGDDMLPVMRDGWVVYCHAVNNVKACLQNLCFVQVTKGGSYIRELREGRKPKHYMLISHNNTLMEDVKIDWAYPIISISPQ